MTDDTDFYYGAPKNDRELAREPQPVRRIERVVVEEPMPERSARRPRGDAVEAPTTETPAEATTSAVGSEPRSPDESLRYGTVEETDEGYAEGRGAAPGGVTKRGAGGRCVPRRRGCSRGGGRTQRPPRRPCFAVRPGGAA